MVVPITLAASSASHNRSRVPTGVALSESASPETRSQVVSKGAAIVAFAVDSAPLQFRYDKLDELFKTSGVQSKANYESVAALRLEHIVHLIDDHARRTHETWSAAELRLNARKPTGPQVRWLSDVCIAINDWYI
jgi:hypothetical protein